LQFTTSKRPLTHFSADGFPQGSSANLILSTLNHSHYCDQDSANSGPESPGRGREVRRCNQRISLSAKLFQRIDQDRGFAVSAVVRRGLRSVSGVGLGPNFPRLRILSLIVSARIDRFSEYDQAIRACELYRVERSRRVFRLIFVRY
jgi:hypothetical protein